MGAGTHKTANLHMEPTDIFSTENSAFALSLIAGGARLLPECPVRHKYTSAFLKTHGAESFQEAQALVPKLLKRGVLGVVIFYFVNDGILADLIRYYDEQMVRLKRGDTNLEMNLSPEECVKVAATVMHNRSALTRGIQKVTPIITVEKADGGVMAASADASEELLRSLGII